MDDAGRSSSGPGRPLTDHQITVAFVDWRALPDAERAMVVRLARRGELPADARIREIARRWAHAMKARPPKPARKGILGMLGIGAVIDAVTHTSGAGGGAGIEAGRNMVERKAAERLLAIEGKVGSRTEGPG